MREFEHSILEDFDPKTKKNIEIESSKAQNLSFYKNFEQCY